MCYQYNRDRFCMYKNYTKRVKIQNDSETSPYWHDFHKFINQTYGLTGTYIANLTAILCPEH